MENEKKCWLKYLGISILIIIGAFLAFYFVTDMTFKLMMNPAFQERRMERMFEHDMNGIMNIDKRMMKHNMKELRKISHYVEIYKFDDAYKVVIDLTPFNDNEKNVEVKADGNNLMIEGVSEKGRGNKEQLTKFSESYVLDDKLNMSKMSSEKIGHDYVVTIPTMD